MNFILSADTVNHLINLVRNKQSGFYIRFGDGDFYLMDGRHDMLATPSVEMSNSYHTLITKYLTTNDMISIPFYCKGLNTLEIGMEPGVHEYPDNNALQFINKIKSLMPNLTTLYSHVALHQVLVHYPELYVSFLKAIIKNNSSVIIGNKDFDMDKIKFYFGNNIYIGGNSNNSFYERDRIWSEFDSALDSISDFTVCILALGCGGRAMSYKFIEQIKNKNKNVLIIDIGSSIDVLMGFRNTRAWAEITNPNINLIDKLLLKNNNMWLTELGYKYNTDKSTYHNFTDFYDSLFHFNKDNIKVMIEVGVLEGASIKMWREYFKNANIYCFDNNEKCKETVNNLSNVVFSLADQNSRESLRNAISSRISKNTVDIIIDDGGHISSMQRNTLECFWPYLKSGGIFIIEDIHTNVKHWYPNHVYWDSTKYYWDESPTLLETLSKIQLGLDVDKKELAIPKEEIKQLILWTQPYSTSATFILIKK